MYFDFHQSSGHVAGISCWDYPDFRKNTKFLWIQMLKLIRKGKIFCEAFQGGVRLKGIGTSIVYVSVYLPIHLSMQLFFLEFQKAFWNTLQQLVGGMPHVIPQERNIPSPHAASCNPDLASMVLISYKTPCEKHQFPVCVFIYMCVRVYKYIRVRVCIYIYPHAHRYI